jgi:hypothetical protein
MKSLLFAYSILSLVAGVDGWINGGWLIGVAGTVAPMLACWAGIGLRSAAITGGLSQWIFGLVMAVILLGTSHWLMAMSAYRIGLFGVSLGGGIWYALGAVFGFLATSRQDTLPQGLPKVPG